MNNTILKTDKDFVVLRVELSKLQTEFETLKSIFPKWTLVNSYGKDTFIGYCERRNYHTFQQLLVKLEDEFV